MNDAEFQDLEDRLTEEMECVLADTAEQGEHDKEGLAPSVLFEIQPTEAAIKLAARAAAAVFLAFEHGYLITNY